MKKLLHIWLGCGWGFHNWGEWSNPWSIRDAVFAFRFQDRSCQCCKKVQERTL